MSSEDLMNFEIPREESSIIKVIGVGGGGSNAVNYMFEKGIKDVSFMVCNTDAQALRKSPVPLRIQLGESLTEGRGAGNKPELGREAAIESLTAIQEILSKNTKMVFITAGMGGGTGTGAAPVIAKVARELGILTVAIVTIPFKFEGAVRINQALEGISELKQYVDSLLVIRNEKLREMFGNLKLSEAFSKADDVLKVAAKGIAEIITLPGYINVDFADVQTIMNKSGVALMGAGEAEGQDRAINAIKEALHSPLLNNNDISGSRNILLNITSGEEEISMDEVGQITDYIQSSVRNHTNIIWGTGRDVSLGTKVNVTIIATGFDSDIIPELYQHEKKPKVVNILEDNKPQDTLTQDDVEFEINPKNKENNNETDSFSLEDKNDEWEQEEEVDKNEQTIAREQEKHQPFSCETDSGEINTKARDTLQKLRMNFNQLKKLNYMQNNEDLAKLENEPAYIRKNIDLENPGKLQGVNADHVSESENQKKEIKQNTLFDFEEGDK